jgi:hypothetical protein
MRQMRALAPGFLLSQGKVSNALPAVEHLTEPKFPSTRDMSYPRACPVGPGKHAVRGEVPRSRYQGSLTQRLLPTYWETGGARTAAPGGRARRCSSEAARTALEAKAAAERAALAEKQARMVRTWAQHDKSILPPIATAGAAQGHAMVWQRDQHYRCTNAPCRAWANVMWPDDERWSGYSAPNRSCPFTHPNHYRGARQ